MRDSPRNLISNLVAISNSISTHGWSAVHLETQSGTIVADDIAANSIQISTTTGHVLGNMLTAQVLTTAISQIGVVMKT